MDVTTLVREYFSKTRAIVEEEDFLIFGDWKAAKSSNTKFKNSVSGELYALGSVWLLVQNKELKPRELVLAFKVWLLSILISSVLLLRALNSPIVCQLLTTSPDKRVNAPVSTQSLLHAQCSFQSHRLSCRKDFFVFFEAVSRTR